ncbi:MAG: zinc ribbon domain-containing protein [Bryobacteraceae bacterium]
MPLYEYKCDKCDAVFEVLQKFSDAPLKVHADCGGAVERQMTAPSFQFKGSGWYATDYAKKSGSNGGSNGNQGDSTGTAKAGEGKESAKETSAKTKESTPSTPAGSSPAPAASSNKP